ncbi:pseudouridine-metabolizing bifunctional protein, partial [Asbolus verrucosus]
GAIPATIAIIKGQIKVGLSENELNQLGDVKISQPIKTSRRDLSFVVANNLNGGTTVSGTLLVANKAGIPVFATGGIGGVHREGETTFDVSADLIELGKSNVAVISSGVKSILDIAKTLEYLETQGVFVATLASDSRDFPAFYSRRSGCQAPYLVKTAQEAAKIIHCCHNLNVQSGMLFAVPVPEKFALDEVVINDVIAEALKDAKRNRIEGKEITPFLLARIGEITAGKSLDTSILSLDMAY